MNKPLPRIIEILLEIIGWLTIVTGITAITALISFAIYTNWNDDTGRIFCIALTCAGFTGGIACASLIWKKYGTINWLSRIRRIT